MAPRTWFLLVLLAALLACAGAAHAAAGADDDKVFACAECKESDTKKKCHQCKCPEWVGDKACRAGCALKYPDCHAKEGKCNDPKCSMPGDNSALRGSSSSSHNTWTPLAVIV